MRVDKIKIGSPKDSPSHKFKNLKDVTIDFDESHWVTVVIGWNGTGKSNVLEALAIIFRDLIMREKQPAFAFVLQYRMGSGADTIHIEIDADPDRAKDPFIIHVAKDSEARGVGTLTPFIEDELAVSPKRGTRITYSAFLKNDEKYIPRYVFSYYSGESPRMYDVFRPYLEKYDSDLRSGKDPGLKRLFYALPVHSQFVLLAFLIQQSDDVRNFLQDHLSIDPDEGIESVLFVLRQPPWADKKRKGGDPRFWNARGIVSEFLYRLYDIAIAPIEISRREPVSLWNKKELQFKYLYIKNVEALRKLVGSQSPAQFFRDLESTHVSQLIEEVRIKIRLKKNDGSVTFRELSEGEQQLLTVLGLLRFTAESESLFLLDEPDTHLNPRWSVDYIAYLRQFVQDTQNSTDSSHILLTTHNPMAIAELEKEQVQVMWKDDSNQINAQEPFESPRGMGYAGILTSDMFGLNSTLDRPTQDLVRERRKLLVEESLNDEQLSRLSTLNDILENSGFSTEHKDSEYSMFLRSKLKKNKELFDLDHPTPETVKQRREVADEILAELKEEK